jgi:hypothetical protein
MLAGKLYGARVIALPDEEDVLSMLKAKGEIWVRELVLG